MKLNEHIETVRSIEASLTAIIMWLTQNRQSAEVMADLDAVDCVRLAASVDIYCRMREELAARGAAEEAAAEMRAELRDLAEALHYEQDVPALRRYVREIDRVVHVPAGEHHGDWWTEI